MIRHIFPLLFLCLTCTCINASEPITNDELRQIFTSYPEIVIFEKEFLSFFADNSPKELEKTEMHNGKYIIEEDVNEDGIDEIVVTGLTSTTPINDSFQCFVAILSKEGNNIQPVYFETFYKYLDDPRSIQNMVLSWSSEYGIKIGFRLESGFFADIRFEDGSYKILFLGR